MKLFIVLSSALSICLCAKLNSNYLPPASAQSSSGANFLNAPKSSFQSSTNNVYNGPTSPPVAILRYNNDNNGEGQYRYDFETENHISQQEQGSLKSQDVLSAQGSFQYQSPEGQTFSISYVADENGFQAYGDHIPTAPPVPEEILKALEKNAADEAAGIVDDGQYRPDSSNEGQYQQETPRVINAYLAPKIGNSNNNNNNGGYRY